MKYFLVDNIDKNSILEVDDPEDAVLYFGGLLSFFPREYFFDRFYLIEQPLKSGKAKIVYHPNELISRGMVYFDPKVYEKRVASKALGKWARK